MSYHVVFDLARAGYKSWHFPAFGLLFVAIGTALVAFRHRLPGWWGRLPRARSAFAFGFLGFAVFWTVTAFVATLRDYVRLKDALNDGRAEVVQGVVSDFEPMPAGGHAMERFCVQKHCFEYSDFVVTAAFNNTASHGGPIREGLPVRVTFVGNKIVKLEVGR